MFLPQQAINELTRLHADETFKSKVGDQQLPNDRIKRRLRKCTELEKIVASHLLSSVN